VDALNLVHAIVIQMQAHVQNVAVLNHVRVIITQNSNQLNCEQPTPHSTMTGEFFAAGGSKE